MIWVIVIPGSLIKICQEDDFLNVNINNFQNVQSYEVVSETSI